MSTYLVAFVICDYSHISEQTEKGVSISVYTPPPFVSQANFALETAIHIMDYFEDFFGVPYPLPKQGKFLIILVNQMELFINIITAKISQSSTCSM